METLLERTSALYYAIDGQERVIAMNRSMRDRIDYEAEATAELKGLARLLYPDTAVREVVLAAHRTALAGKAVRDSEWVLTTRQGDHRVVRWSHVGHGTGDARVVVVVGEDVTDRRKLEHWVRLQNALLERVPEAVIVADLEGRVVHWTGAAERLFGYAPRAALERPLSNLFPEEHARAVALGMIEELRAKGQGTFQRELRRESGEVFDCRIEGSRVQNERGQIVSVALVVTPVTAAPSEVASASAEGPIERLMGQIATQALVTTEGDGTVRTWGRGAERLGAIGVNKAVGKRMFDEVMHSPGLSWEALASRLVARGRHQARIVIERPNGTRAPAEMDAHAVRSPDGTLHTVLFAFSDRSEIQTLGEEALVTKTHALDGVFVEGVVRRLQDACAYFEPDHRFVLARLQDLRSVARLVASGASLRDFETFTRRAKLGDVDREIDDVMYRLGEGVHRLRALVDDITRFSASEVDPPGPVRLTRELDAARELVSHHFENRVDIQFVLDDLPAARASRAPLLRGLAMLLLASAASCEHAENPQVVVEGRHQGGWLYLDFRDNGAGYSVDVQSRLSDFVFLASQPGYAALYLGMARDALRMAGGNLEIGTAAGTGARVRVSFPAADAAVAVQPVEMPKQAGARRGRVLLVEEDELLRRALERHVGEVHHVDSHGTVAEAISALGAGNTYDAAVLAFPRPESFGLRLMSRFAETAPALHRNAVVMAPPGLKHATREKLISQGCIVVTRPVDFTTLRSLLLRLMPTEEIAVEPLEGE
ncbi:MAG: PAS domain S-box protein [Myxococcota bacterium]